MPPPGEPTPRLPEAVPPEHEDCVPSVGQAAGGGKKPHPRDGAKPATQSDGYATCVDRAYVQKEIRWALLYEKPIITVYESESHRPGYFDYAKAAEKYEPQPEMLESGRVQPQALPKGKRWHFFICHHQVCFRSIAPATFCS